MADYSSSPPSLSQLLQLAPSNNLQPQPQQQDAQQQTTHIDRQRSAESAGSLESMSTEGIRPESTETVSDPSPVDGITAQAGSHAASEDAQRSSVGGRLPLPPNHLPGSQPAFGRAVSPASGLGEQSSGHHVAKRRRTGDNETAFHPRSVSDDDAQAFQSRARQRTQQPRANTGPRRSMSSVETQQPNIQPNESGRRGNTIVGEQHSRFFRSPSMSAAISAEDSELPLEINRGTPEEQGETQASDDFQSLPWLPLQYAQPQHQRSAEMETASELARMPLSAMSVASEGAGVAATTNSDRPVQSDRNIMRRGGSSNGDDSDSDDFARPEPPALHHPLPEAPTTPQQAAEAEQSERTGAQGDSAGDESNTCPICFDLWTISGPHQLVALKCGHLFGQSCIRKWITQGNRRHGQRMANRDKGKCPECNQPAARRDMRHIFARSITAVDDERLAETQAEVKKLKDRQGVLETDLAHYQMSFQQMRNEVVKLRNELKESFTKSQWLELENENLKKHTSELADRLVGARTERALGHPQQHCHAISNADRETSSLSNDDVQELIEANERESPISRDERRRCSLARAHTDSMSSVDNATSPGRTGVDRMAGAAASTGSNDSDVDVINAVGAEAILRSTYCPRLRLKAVIPLAVQAGESSRLLAHHPYDHLLYASYSKRSLKFHTLAQINVDDPASPPYMLKALHMDEIRGAEASPHNTGTQYMLTASMDQTAALTSLGCAPSSVGPSSCYAIGAPKRANPMLASRLKLGAQGWSCAWDTADPNLCYAGTAGGRVLAFDLRRTSSPVHTWDGPHDGAVPHTSRRLPAADHQQQQQQKMATGFSPIHGISVIPCQSSSDSARQLTRLVVANSQHLYSLPPMPDRLALADLNASKEATATAQSKEWTRLTGNDGSGGLHSRSCYSVSFDARLNCLAASFRAQDASRVPVTIHELYDVDFNGSSSVWRLRQQVTVNSPQNKWARSTIFSYQPQGPHGRWQGLFCAGVEATRSVRVWDACAQAASELLTLNDVPSPEDIVDVKGWQWSTADSTAVFSTLTNSVVRLYDVR